MLLSLTKHQEPDTKKIYIHVKDLLESSYQLLINGREKVGFKKLRNTKAFIDYSQTTDDVYENLEDYNQTKKRKVLIAFDDINKKWSPILTGSFVRGRKLSIKFFSISQSYLKVPQSIAINATHYFIIKMLKNIEIQQIASKYSSDVGFKVFMILKNYFHF